MRAHRAIILSLVVQARECVFAGPPHAVLDRYPCTPRNAAGLRLNTDPSHAAHACHGKRWPHGQRGRRIRFDVASSAALPTVGMGGILTRPILAGRKALYTLCTLALEEGPLRPGLWKTLIFHRGSTRITQSRDARYRPVLAKTDQH